mmetsp:Transcript_8032/g.11860  ORF Transcript_8032/g.11860 Transcript_8032/m.11860 type:complete len:218 (+) Transcript_8032:4-657(+)
MSQNNPFRNIIDFEGRHSQGSLFGQAALGLRWTPDLDPLDVHLTVKCTLEELFFGCFKEVSYSRRVFNQDRRTTHEETTTKHLLIEPGCFQGHKIVLEGEGSDKMNCGRGNLVIEIEELPHNRFVRKGNDLYTKVTLSLLEAVQSSSVFVETMDKKVLSISMDKCIDPNCTKTIKGEGMPTLQSQKRGDLHVEFNIVFPPAVPEAQRAQLRSVLPIN